MMLAYVMRRVFLRIASMLLCAGIILAATWAATRAYDHHQSPIEQARKYPEAAGGDTPFPGSEEALRLAISGKSDVVRRQLPKVESFLANLGPLLSLVYLGEGNGSDIYQATFQNGTLVWRITMGPDRKMVALRCAAPEGPTAQDWIDHYVLDTTGKGTSRIILAFAKFLALVGLGRFAGIRL
jgi:hypothetical protein